MFESAFNSVRTKLDKRRRYHRLVNEIMGMSERDLADINANRTDMLRHAYRDVYGG